MRKIVLAALLVSGPAFAQPTPLPASTQARDADPNRTICRRIMRIGSRLASQRYCASQAEWDQYRREVRQHLDRMQARRHYSGG